MFQGTAHITATGPLTVEDALADARADAGLDDFGDEGFVEALGAFIDCVQSDVTFTEMGHINFRGSIRRMLVNRLRLQRDVKAHPEILDEDVSDPIMILGMPRTGTTKLQRLMSADPNMQKLALWKLLNPAPFDEELGGNPPSGRIAFAKVVEEATRANPAFTTSHETAAEEADEDSFILLMTFQYPLLFALYPSPSYLAWVRAQPRLKPHEFERQMLQYLQWQDGGRRGRRWILKNPGAVGCLEEIHAVFPKATFVHLHRDMNQVMPSFCRLMEAGKEPLVANLDPLVHGRESLEYWSYEMARYREARAKLGGAIDVMDVPYLDVVQNPMPVIEEAYRRAGLSLTDEGRTAIQAWSDANQQHKHGKAVYTLERYGLTEELIAAAFPKD
jgi:hypothetical protein